MALITITGSVGWTGQNLPSDVALISAALVAIGPARGGIFGPPLSVDGLGQAVHAFQTFQKLPARDGRVDRGGNSLRRINEILNPNQAPGPAPAPAPGGIGTVRELVNVAGLATFVNTATWTPVEQSLTTEMVFGWTGVTGAGTIRYFELDEKVVPRWFGVLIPNGTTSFDKAHIFFHPTPGQAGYRDDQYHSLGNWVNVFHYLSDDFGAQFCAAGMGRLLVMPLMTQGVAGTCGIFAQRWEAILSRIFGMLQSNDMSASAPNASISNLVVSSFSSGIAYSHYFRSHAGLGSRLSGVIDFDGGISTYKHLSAMIRQPAGRVVRMQQMPVTQKTLWTLAANNVFPLPRSRWGGPYLNLFPKNEYQAMLQIHGTIPQTTMYIAARRAG